MADEMSEAQIVDDLTAACTSLGKMDDSDGTYMKDLNCKASLREISRYLATDKKHIARKLLGSLNILSSDLIPIMNQYCDLNEGDPDLFAIILRICTNLTTPLDIIFEDVENPTELSHTKLSILLTKGLYGYKAAFASDLSIWSMLNTNLRHNAEDDVAFERIIILIRNILSIPDNPESKITGQEYYSNHDMCLVKMDKSGLLSTLLHIMSATERGVEYCFHLMEIVYLMLRNQNPQTIARAIPGAASEESDRSAELSRLAQLSAESRKARSRKVVVPRFRGANFLVQNVRSLSDQPPVIRTPNFKGDLPLDHGKTCLRKAKNKKPLDPECSISASNENRRISPVTFSLRTFCLRFLECIFGNYMQHMKHNLIQKKAHEDDEAHFLWALHFFVSLSKSLPEADAKLSDVLTTSTAHFVLVLMVNYQDKLSTEKKHFDRISSKLHLAVLAFRQMLLLMDHATIRALLSSETEYRNILRTLFKQYNEPKHSKLYLTDLIETYDVFMSHGHEPHAEMVPIYCQALRDFKTNEDSTNIAILNFLEKIAQESETCLYQASLFKTLLDIVTHPRCESERFLSLTKDLMQKFVRSANCHRHLYQELLFWKTNDDDITIPDGPLNDDGAGAKEASPPPPPLFDD